MKRLTYIGKAELWDGNIESLSGCTDRNRLADLYMATLSLHQAVQI